MKIKDIRDKDDAQLREDITDLQKQLFTLRQQEVTQKLDDPSSIGKIRKDIARLKTVLTERRHKAAAQVAAK